MGQQPQHRVSIYVDDERAGTINDWMSYEISSSMIEPVDHFTMTRPFDAAVWNLCRTDAAVYVKIDDTPVIAGFIDERVKTSGRDGSMMTISGRDRVGRMVQESAPTVAYNGLDLLTVAKELSKDWFEDVVLSGAKDRIVRLGKKGRKAAAGSEALVVKVKKKTWQHEPGQARYKILNDLCSEAGYTMWSSADGRTLIIGQPIQNQATQFMFTNPTPTGVSGLTSPTAIHMELRESVADRYSMIMALGSGRGDAANYGASTVSRRDIVKNNPLTRDGTGLDFEYPKRLILAERTLQNIEEAQQYAQREMNRRDFKGHELAVTMPAHGQITGGSGASLFTTNTIARCIDEEMEPLPLDAPYLIYSCSYKASRSGETTDMMLVPKGTVFAQ